MGRVASIRAWYDRWRSRQNRASAPPVASPSPLPAAEPSPPLFGYGERAGTLGTIVGGSTLPDSRKFVDGEGFEWKKPSNTINPPRPRTQMAGYNPDTQVVRMVFRDGTPWEYYGVPASVWEEIDQTESTGRLINRTLNHYRYGQADFTPPYPVRDYGPDTYRRR